jgi:FKBP12-rapamycin complex-associated protein
MVPAARVLGRLATSQSTFTADLVDSQVERALEWLQGDRSRLAAVLVLRELAINSPTLIYASVPRILDLVWIAIRDSRQLIRETAAECLSQCLEIIQQRESPQRRAWYLRIWDEITKGLKLNNADATHGSLLAMRELLLHAGMVMILYHYFQYGCAPGLSYLTWFPLVVHDRYVQRCLRNCA